MPFVRWNAHAVIFHLKQGAFIQIAVVDTNHSPEGVDYIIPGNDDSSKAVSLYVRGIADAILEGKANAVQQVLEAVKGDADEFVEEGKED